MKYYIRSSAVGSRSIWVEEEGLYRIIWLKMSSNSDWHSMRGQSSYDFQPARTEPISEDDVFVLVL